MAFRTQKISQMTPKGADLEATDLIEVSTIESGSYVTRSITGQELIDAIPAPSGFVPDTRTLTINGVTQDLSADRTYTIATGLTVGTTPIASGTIGRVLFQGTGNVLQQSSSLFFDSVKESLGLGTSDVATPLGANRGLVINGGTADVHLRLQNNNSGTTANDGALLGYSFGEIYLYNLEVGPLIFGTSNTQRMRIQGNGNVLINTTTDAGFKLDVNGTARVQDNLTIAKNQNALTQINISNTTSGSSASPILNLTSDVASGIFQFGKQSTLTNVYKIIGVKDGFIYNSTTGGDIAILNDFATGKIKFGAGASTTAQMTLFSTGNVGINTTTDAGYKLDVNGTARFVAPNTYAITYDINGNFNAAGAYSNFSLTNAAGSLRAKLNNDGPNGTLTLYQNATGYIFLNGAQSGNNSFISTALSIGNQSAANASSILELTSTTKGFLPPRMTTTQKNAIATPSAGLQVFDTTLNQMSYYNGTTWTNI